MHPVIRKLSLFDSVDPDDAQALQNALTPAVSQPAGHIIADEGQPAHNVYFVLSGLVARTKLMEDGRRQFIAFMLPGDSCDIGVSRLDRRDHSLVALDRSEVAHAADAALLAIMAERPRLAAAFQWAQLVEAGITREWLLNIGQRDAGERIAHLFCEIYHRMKALGLSEGLSCRLRLTQTELGDVVSLSAVHVNRTLQALRHDGLIAYGSGRLTILDLAGLEDFAQFDPTYLHLPAAHRSDVNGPPEYRRQPLKAISDEVDRDSRPPHDHQHSAEIW